MCVGLSALAWGGVAREATKDVMPDSLLPWVLIQGGHDHDHDHDPPSAMRPERPGR